MTADTIETRVARGAALLDEKLPGWVHRIDLDKLDLGSPCRCVLGQTWDEPSGTRAGETPFHLHVERLGLWPDDGDVAHGFNAGGEDWFEGEDEYVTLTAAWRALILARRNEQMAIGGAS